MNEFANLFVFTRGVANLLCLLSSCDCIILLILSGNFYGLEIWHKIFWGYIAAGDSLTKYCKISCLHIELPTSRLCDDLVGYIVYD